MATATTTNIIDRDRIELTVNGVVERLGDLQIEIWRKNPTVFYFTFLINFSTLPEKFTHGPLIRCLLISFSFHIGRSNQLLPPHYYPQNKLKSLQTKIDCFFLDVYSNNWWCLYSF
jgi:hypothetical protein